MSDVLAQFGESIELAYDRLGHQLGWRFLYTPAQTLGPDTRLAFVALNPGDDKYHRGSNVASSVRFGSSMSARRERRWQSVGGADGGHIGVELLPVWLAGLAAGR